MATSFGDLQIDRITTVDTYLSGIASPFKREMTAVMLNWAQSIYPLIRLSSPDLPAELPQVKIISDLGLQAQGMEGMIYFGRDLIDIFFACRKVTESLEMCLPKSISAARRFGTAQSRHIVG